MDYLKLLNDSYEFERSENYCPPENKLQYLSDYIFNFDTYDLGPAELLAEKAIQVCISITERTTFDYIKSPADYVWFIIMCNMPFFVGKISWGTSIRGAFWDSKIELSSCGLWNKEKAHCEQLFDLSFNLDEWNCFVNAMANFRSNP